MEYTTVNLLPEFEHRYKFKAGLYYTKTAKFERVNIMLDLGCYNTLIPRYHAELSGSALGFWREYRIGGQIIKAEAFSIGKIMIGDFVIERVLAFAGEYPGDYEDEILLGTNVMNNWEMLINKESNTFKFRENPPAKLPNKTHIYQNYFNPSGNYQYAQNSEQSITKAHEIA